MKVNVLHILGRWRFFRQIAFSYAKRSDKLNIEIFSKNDIFLKTGLDLEVFELFFTDVTQLEHAICDFFVE